MPAASPTEKQPWPKSGVISSIYSFASHPAKRLAVSGWAIKNSCPGASVRCFDSFEKGPQRMIIADLSEIAGRTYPARRRTKNLVGGASPIQAVNFSMGYVTLEPNGGQVPWHNQEQEEIYFIVEGSGEMCLGEERFEVGSGQAVYIPTKVFHQLTNTGSAPMRMIYCYGPAGD